MHKWFSNISISLKEIIGNKRFIIGLYIVFALAAGVQSLLSGTKTFYEGGNEYSKYNNYTIFEKSFDHLKNNQDLYILYPQEHWDLYKYTPTFSVFFGVIAIFPDWVGLNLWNLLNALVLLFAVYYLPRLSQFQKGLVLLFVLIELITSMQNAQSNALIAGLLVFSFGLLEKKRAFFAAFCIVFSVFIKLFGIVGFALFLFYPKKWKLALYSLFWTALLFALPLLYIDIEQYMILVNSYLDLLANDHATSYGYSVMGWLHSWFSAGIDKNFVVLAGVLLFLIPLYKIRMYKEFMFRYLMLTSVLLWIVIFNHKAESPTFIIAMTGVALWFVFSEKNVLNIVLFTGAFIFTSLSPTDLFPAVLREEFVKPFALKVFPCILIWMKVIYDLIVLTPNQTTSQRSGS